MMRFTHTTSTQRLLVAVSLMMLTGTSVTAVGQIWDGGGINDNWSTAANWIGNIAPLNNGTADIVFLGVVRTTPFIDATWSVQSITFTAAAPFTIGGSAIILDGDIANQDNNVQTLSNSLIFLLDHSSFRADLADLVINPPVQMNGYNLFVSGSHTTHLNNILTSGQVIKRGPGNLELNGSGSLNNLTIEEGAVVFGSIAPMNMTTGILLR